MRPELKAILDLPTVRVLQILHSADGKDVRVQEMGPYVYALKVEVYITKNITNG